MSVKPDPIRGASYIAFGYPTDPPVHDPDWKRIDEATGLPICVGCGMPLYAALWAAGTCPGKPA